MVRAPSAFVIGTADTNESCAIARDARARGTARSRCSVYSTSDDSYRACVDVARRRGRARCRSISLTRRVSVNHVVAAFPTSHGHTGRANPAAKRIPDRFAAIRREPLRVVQHRMHV
jgi:hypothetical protein